MSETPLAAARRVADELLRPLAADVDLDGVPRSHVRALAEAGLLGVSAPTEFGGTDQPPEVMRGLVEILAGADASTWFVWSQHHTPVRTLARGSNHELRAARLPALAAGELLAGVAFTHLRRPGPPVLEAEPVGGGWRLRGDIAWLTSWGLADLFLVAGTAGADIVWALVPLPERAGVTVRELPLTVMQGTHTVGVHLDGVDVDAAEVVLVEPIDDWRAADRERTADVSPAVFGITGEAVRRLREVDSPAALGAAASLDGQLDQLRRSAYAAQDAGADRAVRLALRGDAHALALRATAALVAAGAGRSMLAGSPGGRLARVAEFLLVQGQDADARAAQLGALSEPGPRGPGAG